MPLSKKIAHFNKYVTNKLLLLFAGWLTPLAVIHHKGRKSGKNYRTPVMAFQREPGFVIALTYGRNVDWVKNLIAADGGIIEYNGEKTPIHDIRIREYHDHEHLFPRWVRPSLSRIKVGHILLAEKRPQPSR